MIHRECGNWGNTLSAPEGDFTKKVFLIEGHALKKGKPNPSNVITFSNDDYGQVNPSHANALMVKLDIVDQDVMKILVDDGSSVDILYYYAYNRMLLDGYEIQSCRELPMCGFENKSGTHPRNYKLVDGLPLRTLSS